MSGTAQLVNLSFGSRFSALAPAAVVIPAFIPVAGVAMLCNIVTPNVAALLSKLLNFAWVSFKKFSRSPAIIALRCKPKRLISVSLIFPFSRYKHSAIKPNIGRKAIRA